MWSSHSPLSVIDERRLANLPSKRSKILPRAISKAGAMSCSPALAKSTISAVMKEAMRTSEIMLGIGLGGVSSRRRYSGYIEANYIPWGKKRING